MVKAGALKWCPPGVGLIVSSIGISTLFTSPLKIYDSRLSPPIHLFARNKYYLEWQL